MEYIRLCSYSIPMPSFLRLRRDRGVGRTLALLPNLALWKSLGAEFLTHVCWERRVIRTNPREDESPSSPSDCPFGKYGFVRVRSTHVISPLELAIEENLHPLANQPSTQPWLGFSEVRCPISSEHNAWRGKSIRVLHSGAASP